MNGDCLEGKENRLQSILAHPRFEIVPLKWVKKQFPHLPLGAAVSVTCSPRYGLDRTVDVARMLQTHGFCAIPHISARQVTGRDHLEALLEIFGEAGIREIFVIGGDCSEPVGPFSSAGELLHAMADLDHEIESIGIGAYPEGHPLIGDEALIEALQDKEQVASYMVTQICFEPETVIRWLGDIRRRGIELPVYLGVPGAVKLGKLIEISLRIGVGDSIRFLRKHGGMLGQFLRGQYRPDAFVHEAAAFASDPQLNIKGLYFFTFNQVENTEKWRAEVLRDSKATASID